MYFVFLNKMTPFDDIMLNHNVVVGSGGVGLFYFCFCFCEKMLFMGKARVTEKYSLQQQRTTTTVLLLSLDSTHTHLPAQ